jgi:hypothetical protein
MRTAREFRELADRSIRQYQGVLDFLYGTMTQEASRGYCSCDFNPLEINAKLGKGCTIEELEDILIGRGFRVVYIYAENFEISW